MKQSQYNYLAANVSYVVVFGTSFVVAAIAILLGISWSTMHNPDALASLIVCTIAGLYLWSIYALLRRHHYRLTAYMLILFYLLVATNIEWTWGVNTPIGLLILGLVIVLAGILLNAYHALIMGLLSGLILVTLQAILMLGWHLPNTTWTSPSTFGDVLAYCLIYSMLALICWLYNREMERALTHAKQAETALLHQKSILKKQVKARTQDLRQVQLEEMRQMYNFAKLGQLGITLLHDLANHLTALTLEIEGMEDRQHPKEMARVQQIIRYLSGVVESTRERLHGGTKKQTFDMVRKMNDTMAFLHHKASQHDVTIEWRPPIRSWKYMGDADSFRQIIAILTNNAIDAYSDSTQKDARPVVVTMRVNNVHVVLSISDWGKGISKTRRKQLFKPQHSSKKSGLGLGLYIAKQIVEMQFRGSLTLSPKSDHTEFIVKLPLSNGK